MDMNTKAKISKVWRVLKWTIIGIFAVFIVAVIVRIPHAIQENKIDAQILKIHSTKLTMDDVMGVNMPPDPGTEADKTVAGIDANKNGIRDDVELAIFKEYPNSAKTRAVLLQYALALQVRLSTDLVNDGDINSATSILTEYGVMCVRNIFAPLYIQAQKATGEPYDWEKVRPAEEAVRVKEDAAVSLVRNAMLNTEARKVKFEERSIKRPTYRHEQKYPIRICDIDFSALPN